MVRGVREKYYRMLEKKENYFILLSIVLTGLSVLLALFRAPEIVVLTSLTTAIITISIAFGSIIISKFVYSRGIPVRTELSRKDSPWKEIKEIFFKKKKSR